MAGSEFGAERGQDDPIEAPVDDETPGDYEPTERSGGRSPDTGVTYESTGEPEVTPHDLELVQADDEEDTP